MRNYFKLPNNIFDYKLSANELIVISFLYSILGHNNLLGKCVKVKQATIAKRCFLSVQVVARCLDSLMRKDLITSKIRAVKGNGHLSTCSYVLKDFNEKANYFTIDRKIFGFLNAKQMRIFLFLSKCIDVEKNECFNSYTDISNDLHMKRSDVIDIIAELSKLGFV